jgi:hypothetical protein
MKLTLHVFFAGLWTMIVTCENHSRTASLTAMQFMILFLFLATSSSCCMTQKVLRDYTGTAPELIMIYHLLAGNQSLTPFGTPLGLLYSD